MIKNLGINLNEINFTNILDSHKDLSYNLLPYYYYYPNKDIQLHGDTFKDWKIDKNEVYSLNWIILSEDWEDFCCPVNILLTNKIDIPNLTTFVNTIILYQFITNNNEDWDFSKLNLIDESIKDLIHSNYRIIFRFKKINLK